MRLPRSSSDDFLLTIYNTVINATIEECRETQNPSVLAELKRRWASAVRAKIGSHTTVVKQQSSDSLQPSAASSSNAAVPSGGEKSEAISSSVGPNDLKQSGEGENATSADEGGRVVKRTRRSSTEEKVAPKDATEKGDDNEDEFGDAEVHLASKGEGIDAADALEDQNDEFGDADVHMAATDAQQGDGAKGFSVPADGEAEPSCSQSPKFTIDEADASTATKSPVPQADSEWENEIAEEGSLERRARTDIREAEDAQDEDPEADTSVKLEGRSGPCAEACSIENPPSFENIPNDEEAEEDDLSDLSELDDAEPVDRFNGDLIVAQFNKVFRTDQKTRYEELRRNSLPRRSIWRAYLSCGIMRIGGKEMMFDTCEGEFRF